MPGKGKGGGGSPSTVAFGRVSLVVVAAETIEGRMDLLQTELIY